MNKTATKVIGWIVSIVIAIIGASSVTKNLISNNNVNNQQTSVYIDGKLVSVETQKLQDLYDIQEAKVKQLEEDNNNLKIAISEARTEIEELKSVRISSKDNSDSDNSSQDIGISSESHANWMDKNIAYDSQGVDIYSGKDGKSFTMSGQKFSSGYVMWHNSNILFNLGGKYSNLKFDIGRVDGTDPRRAVLNIFLDGELTNSLELDPEDLAQTIDIPLNNAKQMKIQLLFDTSVFSRYGLGNGIIT